MTMLAGAARAESWEMLRGLKAGDQVMVEDTNHQEVKGRFASVTDDAITVESKQGVVSVDRVKVKKVKLRSASRRARNAAIGAAIGVAVGLAVDQTLGTRLRNESGDGGRPINYIAPIAGFAALGGAFPAYRTVYSK